MKAFNDRFLFMTKQKIKPNIIIVASWQTNQQIDNELLNHTEFGMITDEQFRQIRQLSMSTVAEDNEKALLMRREIISEIRKHISFFGYQAFFNLLFPNKNIAQYGQNIDTLISEYESGTLKPSAAAVTTLQNTIIVVDEMQRLYSSMGLNTYNNLLLSSIVAFLSYLATESETCLIADENIFIGDNNLYLFTDGKKLKCIVEGNGRLLYLT